MSVRGEDLDIADVSVRLGASPDVAYMFKRSLQDLRNWILVHGMPDGLYHQYMHRALEHTFTRAITLIAYPKPAQLKMQGSNVVRSSDSSHILGFLVADPTDLGLVIHYMNTRKSYNDHGTLTEDFRRRGIARKLVETAIQQYKLRPDKIFYTLKTPMFRYEKAFREKIKNDKRFVYNPMLFFTLLPAGWETGIRRPGQQFLEEMRL